MRIEVDGSKKNITGRPAEISAKGLKVIGRGATATVYRIDEDTIVKVYDPGVNIDMVERETARAGAAFNAGIPTARVYGTVKVDDRYGTVFEYLEADDLQSRMVSDKERIAEFTALFARETAAMHRIKVNPGDFDDVKLMGRKQLKKLVGIVCDDRETEILASMYDILPERETFFHGDCHPANAMVRNGKVLFIDLSKSGMGHPVFDMATMAFCYRYPAMLENFEQIKSGSDFICDFSRDEVNLIWNTFLCTYLDTDDRELLKEAERQALAYAALNYLFTAVDVPGLLPASLINEFKRKALDYCKDIRPLCF